jgi:hypothetical protein
MKLRSDEICMVSVARSGVLVKADKPGRFRRRSVGFFAAVLYNEKDVYKAAKTALALGELFIEKRIPVTLQNPVLNAYANAIWQCSSAAEVAVTLNEAVAKAEAQAKNDEKIVGCFADLMASGETKSDAYYDVSVLPYSKEAILQAIEREIVRESLDARVEWLKVGAVFLTSFQEGIGPKPLYFLGSDLAKLRDLPLQQRANVISENGERVRRFSELARAEDDRISARIDSAVRSRNARLS